MDLFGALPVDGLTILLGLLFWVLVIFRPDPT